MDCGPLVSEETSLSTEPQPLPLFTSLSTILFISFCSHQFSSLLFLYFLSLSLFVFIYFFSCLQSASTLLSFISFFLFSTVLAQARIYFFLFDSSSHLISRVIHFRYQFRLRHLAKEIWKKFRPTLDRSFENVYSGKCRHSRPRWVIDKICQSSTDAMMHCSRYWMVYQIN